MSVREKAATSLTSRPARVAGFPVLRYSNVNSFRKEYMVYYYMSVGLVVCGGVFGLWWYLFNKRELRKYEGLTRKRAPGGAL